jgi:hypothetical protein
LIVATFVFLFAAPPGDASQSVLALLEASMLAAALWTAGVTRGYWAAVALLLVAVLIAVAQLTIDNDTLEGCLALLIVVLVAATILMLAVGVFDQGTVNRQSISGAVCIYLLLGIAFTLVYGAVAELDSDALFTAGTDGTTSDRVYFSFVTLATLGYGDFTAAEALGRSLAVTEALLGQLYLVTVVALLVGHYGQPRVRQHHATSAPPSPAPLASTDTGDRPR